jgi:hypothetical protein
MTATLAPRKFNRLGFADDFGRIVGIVGRRRDRNVVSPGSYPQETLIWDGLAHGEVVTCSHAGCFGYAQWIGADGGTGRILFSARDWPSLGDGWQWIETPADCLPWNVSDRQKYIAPVSESPWA